MNRFTTTPFIVLLLSMNLFSQEDKKFRAAELPQLLLGELNRFRAAKGLDTLEMTPRLQNASKISAQNMSDDNSEKVERSTTMKILKGFGATKRGEEITMKAVISKGREDFSAQEVAKVIYTRWENNPKDLAVITNPKYKLTGINSSVDENGEKIYVSAFFGGYDITNEGLAHKKELAVPYNKKSKKLQGPDERLCKTCERWRNYDLLQKGLYVSGDKIFLKYPNARDLRRVLKTARDGFAVDVVQRSQYLPKEYNLVDNNLLNKGVMSKVIYRDKFYKKNLLLSKDPKQRRKEKGIEVLMGKFDPKITGPYELNLLVIQDKHICKTITRGYNETGITESSTPIGLLPMKNSKGLKPPFEPRNESSILNFTIPFEKNKSEFKPEDIQPFLKALDEPEFIIDGLYIYAYSSIEGDSAANAKLQHKRAESVVSVLQSMQNTKINPTIQTKDSWGLFLLENEDTQYADLVNLGKAKAIAKLNSDKKLLEELEPVLARERFAQIIMDVTYDVSGDKELKFAVTSFDKAVKAGNPNLPYKILDFMQRRIAEGRYPAAIYDSLRIEESARNAGVINNRIYYKYLLSNAVDETDAATFERLLKTDPANPVLQYNTLFCQLKLDSNAGSADRQAQVQQSINGLYGRLDSTYVNGLNIEWQFRIMESLDTLANAEVLIEACIERIKQFYSIKEATWQNALKLAGVFNRAKDYRYAANLLEPYLDNPGVNENLVFMYISSASRVQEKYYSRKFAKALETARDKNPERYCKLFGEPFMTFQVLENPEVKKVYQSSCGQ